MSHFHTPQDAQSAETADMRAFRTRLGMALTAMDERASKRPGHNPWALPQYFAAADEVAEMVAAGATHEQAFAECFTPTRGMHTVARKLGLALDVDRGRWIPSATPTK